MYLNTGRIYNNCKHIILQNITLKLESLVATIPKVYRHFQLNDVVFMHKNNICVVLIRIDGCAGLLSIKPTWGYDRSVMTGLHQNSLTLRHMTVCDTCPLCAGGQLKDKIRTKFFFSQKYSREFVMITHMHGIIICNRCAMLLRNTWHYFNKVYTNVNAIMQSVL